MRWLIFCAAVAAVISVPATAEIAGRNSQLALGTLEEDIQKNKEPIVLPNRRRAYFCGTSLYYCLYNCTLYEARCLSARSSIGDRMCTIHARICKHTCRQRCEN